MTIKLSKILKKNLNKPYLTKYKQAELFLQTKKAKKMKMSLGARMMYLAIAKECDKQNKDSIALDDDQILEAMNAELAEYTIKKVKILGKLIDKSLDDQKAINMVYQFCLITGKDMEETCNELISLIKDLKKIPEIERKKIINEIPGILFQ